MSITNENTAAIMFYTQFADFVKIQRLELWLLNDDRTQDQGYEILADGFNVGVCVPMRQSFGWVCVLNTPHPAELLTAPSRNDVIGLALRIANQLCAKAVFGSPDP